MWNSPCMKWNVFHICLPHISVYKMDILLLFLYFVFRIVDFSWLFHVVIWVMCCFMGYVGYLWLLSTILYTYIYICFLYVLSTITFQTFSGSFSRHRSLKETSIWLTDLQVSVSVQTGTFQKIANNIYIMEMLILGLMIPKKNAAVCNGITIVLCEMEGCNMVPKFKVFFCPVFQDGPCMKWKWCWFFHFIRGMGSSIPYRYSQGG